MLSYRHAYHAGNFADVFKHVILIQLIRTLQFKDKPFCLLDTHAGAGRYDLESPAACKTAEFREGIARLWGKSGLGAALQDYLDIVRAINDSEQLRYYPGSPRIARSLLRSGDRLLLTELHNTEYPLLKAEFAGDRQVSVHHMDGYQALKALLPPRERRGLVLLDPAYERKNEFQHLLEALATINRRWPNAITAVWYPILQISSVTRFHKALHNLGIPAILCAELELRSHDLPLAMRGCGMIIVNPPWRLDETLEGLLVELLRCLQTGDNGQTRLQWLVN